MSATAAAIGAIVIASLLMLLSIPLVMRSIPMNPDYGFRWKEAFESDRNWYEINAHGGWCMLIGNLPLLLLAVFSLIRPGAISDFPVIGGLVFWISMMVIIVLSYACAQRIHKKT